MAVHDDLILEPVLMGMRGSVPDWFHPMSSFETVPVVAG